MRYGNAGQMYRTCNANFGSVGPRKPPEKFTPLITPAEFAEDLGRTYSKMSSSQRENYHRLGAAQSMRDKREEERKQASMNNKEYKDYLVSKKSTAKTARTDKVLFNKQERLQKDLRKEIDNASGGRLLEDEDAIKKAVKEAVGREEHRLKQPSYRDEWESEKIKERLQEEGGETNFKKLQAQSIKEGVALSNKKGNVVRVGKSDKKLGTIIKEFGMNDNWNIRLGIGKKADVEANADKLFKHLTALSKITWSATGKKYNEAPNDYSGFKTIFKKLASGKIDGLLPPQTPGLPASELSKRKKQRAGIKQASESIQKAYISNDSDNAKKVRGELGEAVKKNIRTAKDLKPDVEKEFQKHLKDKLEANDSSIKDKIFSANFVLEESRNIARKNDIDEKWIQKNIKVSLDEEGRPLNRLDLLNDRLIRAKTITENLEGIEDKIKLSRELKRKNKK
tara:strand:+ start:3644 stop:4999 length:1356 start_codon:yes stop_codon:yes gene_type:complete